MYVHLFRRLFNLDLPPRRREIRKQTLSEQQRAQDETVHRNMIRARWDEEWDEFKERVEELARKRWQDNS